MANPRLDDLGERLGIVLRDPEAIRQAFIHSSFLNEHPGAAPGHNERLEFLGDAVIGLVVSRLLYDRFPDEDEGFLTARRAALSTEIRSHRSPSSWASTATSSLDVARRMGVGRRAPRCWRRPSRRSPGRWR